MAGASAPSSRLPQPQPLRLRCTAVLRRSRVERRGSGKITAMASALAAVRMWWRDRVDSGAAEVNISEEFNWDCDPQAGGGCGGAGERSLAGWCGGETGGALPVPRPSSGQAIEQQPGGQSSHGQSDGQGSARMGHLLSGSSQGSGQSSTHHQVTAAVVASSQAESAACSRSRTRSASRTRRRSSSARTSASRSRSRVSVWPQGHWPWSATWSSSPISRSRSPARWAPLIRRSRPTASWS
jgi:hypothetical protein